MSWTAGTKVTPAVGGSVRIKTKTTEPALSAPDQNALGQSVADARRALRVAMERVGARQAQALEDEINMRWARYLLAPAPTWNERYLLIKRMKLTLDGLNGRLAIKVTASATANGWVRSHLGAEGVIKGLFSSDYTLGTRDGKPVSRGHIHIASDALAGRTGAIAVIHEASHKFASTADHGKSGYVDVNNPASFLAPGLTRTQAANNADSLAYFAYAVGNLP